MVLLAPLTLVPEPATAALCPKYTDTKQRMRLAIDNSFFLYQGCTCQSGFVGHAPWCFSIPLKAIVRPFSAPMRDGPMVEGISTMPYVPAGSSLAILNTSYTTFADVAYAFLKDSGRATSDVPVKFNTSTVSLPIYSTFTDAWYTRSTASTKTTPISTSWNVDLSTMRSGGIIDASPMLSKNITAKCLPPASSIADPLVLDQ